MKAVIINQFGSPDVLEYVDISKPIPQAGEVLVKNVAIGAWKPDCLVRSGHYPYLKKQPPMLTIGNECAGYVESVGEGVTDFKPGMPVWVVHMPGYGAYAEYTCVDQSYVTVLPETISPDIAPGLGSYTVAYSMLNDAGRGTDGKSLYILGGAGNVGTALIKIALAQGWEVISAADTLEKCKHLERIGTIHVFDCTKRDQYEAVMEFTNGRGVDLVFDQWVGEKLYPELKLLADFGMIVVYNWMEGAPKDPFFPHMVQQATHATAVRPFSTHVYDNNPERKKKLQQDVFDFISSGKVVPDFYGRMPLSEAKQAHELLDNNKIISPLIIRIHFTICCTFFIDFFHIFENFFF